MLRVRLAAVFVSLAMLAAVAPAGTAGGEEAAIETESVEDPLAASGITLPDGAEATTLSTPRPAWYTDEVHARVLAAGTSGVEVNLGPRPFGGLNPDCLGWSPPSVSTAGVSLTAVSAGGCMVYPNGCSMNFIFADSSSNYIGTAGHCVSGSNTVVMQVATRVDPTDSVIVTLAKIGRVAKSVNQGIGRDFALVKIDPGWAVVSGVAGAMGPTGVFCGDPVGQQVTHYGHGYVFFVEQGIAKVGEVIPDVTLVYRNTDGYAWIGYGLPGDSGSDVMGAGLLAVGNLSHGLSLLGVPVPGLSFGMQMNAIFNYIGSAYSLVTVDGRRVKCSTAIGGLVGV